MDQKTGDHYVGITLTDGAWNVESATSRSAPFVDAELQSATLQKLDALSFVPYYFRANRGGKGHMRVGLRKL